jgi:hypothetical protein
MAGLQLSAPVLGLKVNVAFAVCDPHGQPPIVLVREASTRTTEAAKQAKRASARVLTATKVRAAHAARVRVAVETEAAGDGDIETARVADR